ncbi:methylated-DNA--[protein]-cysteine S-methyltransferase [Ornithinimicrobium faecis]|uniref:Methylated-DNA--protein-cysteine methyltransferase n=1 Tax=Ornithinimicrobium faecis TaxID=2934158 RepID=A0ABY4YP08_9MICO|nr:methylated-DNA--[protein]-cysteine S-methyltransferase [Ornithinimicrobium sp. HY1793]USQ78520.1 methylated-DNA--[protein]-cysteine S-methyltransferase [Ornithinimicrobium sp. HY1793]
MTDHPTDTPTDTPTGGPTDGDLLERLATPTELAGLHRLLEVRAEQEGLLDVAYRTLDSPVGTLLLAATTTGLVRVAYEREDLDVVLESLASAVGPRVLRAPARLDEAARQVDEYFAGTRTAFDLPLDHALSRGFRGQVHAYLSRIPYGHTESYGEVAEHVGSPRAVRAVGTACATNPLPVVVPCHRVLRSDGSLGGYLGGTAAKTTLLELERAA